MTIDRRLLAGALGLSLLVVACGGSSTPSSGAGTATQAPQPTAPATTPATATEEPEATEEATEEAPPPEEATDNGGSAGEMNDLASKLPEKAGNVTFERVGFDGDQLGLYGAAAGFDSEELEPILKANGKTLSDVNFAIATSTSSEATGMVYAIQIEGVLATTFAEGMSQDLASMPKLTMGGKTVFGEAAGGYGFFAYPKDDILFLILLMDQATATEIVGHLP